MSKSKILTLTAAGLAVGWLIFATPAKSEAQSFSFGIRSPGIGLGFGSGYGRGFGYSGFNTGSRFYGNYGYGGFNNGYYGNYGYGGINSGYSNYYGSPYGYGYGGRAIVQPQFSHWTPNRGFHTHGQVLVPSYGGYYPVPY